MVRLGFASGQVIEDDRQAGMLRLLMDRYTADEILDSIQELCYTFDGSYGQVVTVAHIARSIEDRRSEAVKRAAAERQRRANESPFAEARPFSPEYESAKPGDPTNWSAVWAAVKGEAMEDETTEDE